MAPLPNLTRLRCNELRRECGESKTYLVLLVARDVLCLLDECESLGGTKRPTMRAVCKKSPDMTLKSWFQIKDVLALIDELLTLRNDHREKANRYWVKQCKSQKAKDKAGVK